MRFTASWIVQERRPVFTEKIASARNAILTILLIVSNSGCGLFDTQIRVYSKECAGIVVQVHMTDELKAQYKARADQVTKEELSFLNAIGDNNHNLKVHCG